MHQSERVVAFRDLNPVAPVHVLVIPREHYRNVVELSADVATAAELLEVVAEVANTENVADGFRTVFNTGGDAGQEVDHVHAQRDRRPTDAVATRMNRPQPPTPWCPARSSCPTPTRWSPCSVPTTRICGSSKGLRGRRRAGAR